MMLTECLDIDKEDNKADYLVEGRKLSLLFEFADTLAKIKSLEIVSKICFTKMVSDIYIVTKKENLDENEKIIKLFAQWESTYKIFPEVHIISEEEEFYIPQGASRI